MSFPCTSSVVRIYVLFALFLLPIPLQAQCWEYVSCGSWHSLAIRNNGSLWAWGANLNGQLGDGSNVFKTIPVQVGNSTQWMKTEAGDYHSIGLRTDGTIWAWGNNGSGQLGQGNVNSSNVPIPIGMDTNWIDIAAGGDFCLALKQDGSLWAWGKHTYGQLGIGSNTTQTLPVRVDSLHTYIHIACGLSHALAIRSDSTLWAWGYNLSGQLGTGNNINTSFPTLVDSQYHWLRATAGKYHSLAIRTDGSLWSWGLNGDFQLGNGSTISSNAPLLVDSVEEWVQLAAGGNHSLGTTQSGYAWCWGDNFYGQLGIGNTVSQSLPIQCSSNTNHVMIAAGERHSMVLQQSNQLSGCGYNNDGAVGNGSQFNQLNLVPILCSNPVAVHLPGTRKNLIVSPNPTQTILYCTNTGLPIQINLVSSIGIELRTIQINHGRTPIDVSELGSGYYFLIHGFIHSSHQTVQTHQEQLVFTYYKSFYSEDASKERRKLEQRSESQLAHDLLNELERIYPNCREWITDVVIRKIGHGMISPQSNYVFSNTWQQFQEARNGLYFCHTDFCGMSIFEEAFYKGLETANRIQHG